MISKSLFLFSIYSATFRGLITHVQASFATPSPSSPSSFLNKTPETSRPTPTPTSSITTTPKRKKRPRIPVLTYEDNWVCVNKPAGITVHRSKEAWGHKVVLSTSLKRQLSRKVFPVHRLDHRTSGAILFAFDSNTCGLLHDSLRSKDAKKEYIALLRGHWFMDTDHVVVTKPLNVDGVEKEARTEFTLLATFEGRGDRRKIGTDLDFLPACSLVRCTPTTGRTHQIRRHARAMGFPIIGDSRHGDSKVNRWWRLNWELDRLALHCFSLDLPPLNEEEEEEDNRIKCVAPLSPELKNVFQRDELKDMWQKALEKEPRLDLDAIDVKGGTFGRHYKKEILAKQNEENL